MNSILSDMQTQSGSVPTVVRTCYGGVGQKNRMDFVVTEGTHVLAGGSGSVESLEALLRARLAETKPSRFDAYGHSYGGWLVGRVVEDLGPGDAESYTLNVVLSDAVSRPLCTPSVVIFGFGRADYCGHFPLDLQPSVIRANVKGYFGTASQNEDWLHSTPISGAENFTFNPGQPVRPRAFNHRALFTMPLAWGGFRTRFQYR